MMFPFLFLLFCVIFNVHSNPVSTKLNCPSGSNDCVKNAVKEMYARFLEPNADIGAENMDPMYQKLIEADLVDIKYKVTNTTVLGYRTCEVQNASPEYSAQILQLEFLCHKFDLQGQYDIKGKLLSQDIEGNGDYGFQSGKYRLVIDIYIETVSNDGKKYKKIKNFSFKAEPLERLQYQMTNLFGGNKELGYNFLKFVNENSKPVAYILQDPILRANIKKIVKNANKYLKNLPLD